MPLLSLLPLLLLAVLAVAIGRGAMQRSRRLRAADGRPRPLLEVAALTALGLVILIAVAAAVVAPYSMETVGWFGCMLLPAQIAMITLASGMLGRDYGDGCAVAMLWLVTFGIGLCYGAVFTRGLGG